MWYCLDSSSNNDDSTTTNNIGTTITWPASYIVILTATDSPTLPTYLTKANWLSKLAKPVSI